MLLLGFLAYLLIGILIGPLLEGLTTRGSVVHYPDLPLLTISVCIWPMFLFIGICILVYKIVSKMTFLSYIGDFMFFMYDLGSGKK